MNVLWHVAGFGIRAQIPGHEAPGGEVSDIAAAHVAGQPGLHGVDTGRG